LPLLICLGGIVNTVIVLQLLVSCVLSAIIHSAFMRSFIKSDDIFGKDGEKVEMNVPCN